MVPGTAPGAMDFVGEAFGDGWGHRDTCPGGQFLGRNIQQNIFQWECSGPAYLTLQLRDLTHVYLFFTCEQTSQLLKVIMLMRTVMVLLRSFQSRNQQVVQLSMADPGVGRSKVVFEVWSQDATEKLSPTPSEPVFFPGDGE